MKKNILLIVILMSLCVTGIVGLQLFWNYQNYKTTVRAFDHDINEALGRAIASETDQRQEKIVARFKGWMADTSLIIITADHKNRDSATVFKAQDAHPKFKEDKTRKLQFGLSEFKKQLDHITPEAKTLMIEHFGDRILKPDLKEGIVYNYTQMLGDSLEKVFSSSKTDLMHLQQLFRMELDAKNINAAFVLNPGKRTGLYLTQPFNTNFRKPYKKDLVYAGFESPGTYFFKEMKWVVVTSLLLIAITISCFTYTLKTLFSQHQLAGLKDSFINNITHELNTPIASIKITAEALKTFTHQPEKQSEYLNIISYQADKLNDLTSQILNTGRLIKNNNINYAEVDLRTLVIKAIDNIRPQMESRDASIDYTPPAAAIQVSGDNGSLCNVLLNLLDNALKYNDTEYPVITIGISEETAHATITVADNGIGIAREYHNAIFGQFFRVPQGDLHDVKGFGLGLSYVQQIINQHNGIVSVKSNYPSGCIFTIQLPLS